MNGSPGLLRALAALACTKILQTSQEDHSARRPGTTCGASAPACLLIDSGMFFSFSAKGRWVSRYNKEQQPGPVLHTSRQRLAFSPFNHARSRGRNDVVRGRRDYVHMYLHSHGCLAGSEAESRSVGGARRGPLHSSVRRACRGRDWQRSADGRRFANGARLDGSRARGRGLRIRRGLEGKGRLWVECGLVAVLECLF
ncbi:hypothetical protein FB451DRAFT_236211 [Mycena latifolia]|nr:hypothetical protein FB451DRAFT_236211 [Mycena latifolia]